MPNVIQELAGEEIIVDFAHVTERVNEWRNRLSNLYAQIIEWLPEFSSDQNDSVEMNEELMREYGVSPLRLPVLQISNGNQQVARFMPRGLWIIGANGRVDLFAKNGQFIIVDRSEYYSLPHWEIASSSDRRNASVLSRDELLQTMR